MSATPEFVYHPDPVATGSASYDDSPCEVCGEPAELRYEGPIYGNEVDVVCLRCIASGRAAQALGEEGNPASFTDIGDSAEWDEVPTQVIKEVLHRTPGFLGWQQEQWLAHCGDAATFVGPAGIDDLDALGEAAVEAVRAGLVLDEVPEDIIEDTVASLSRDDEPTAYMFRCRHCGSYLAYVDLA